MLVDGVHCPYVGHRCVDFLNEEKDVCRAYAPEVLCEGRLERLRFCIDTYEYPNLEGATPVVMVDFDDAKRACAVSGSKGQRRSRRSFRPMTTTTISKNRPRSSFADSIVKQPRRDFRSHAPSPLFFMAPRAGLAPFASKNPRRRKPCAIAPVLYGAGTPKPFAFQPSSMRARGTPDARAHPQPRVQK